MPVTTKACRHSVASVVREKLNARFTRSMLFVSAARSRPPKLNPFLCQSHSPLNSICLYLPVSHRLVSFVWFFSDSDVLKYNSID